MCQSRGGARTQPPPEANLSQSQNLLPPPSLSLSFCLSRGKNVPVYIPPRSNGGRGRDGERGGRKTEILREREGGGRGWRERERERGWVGVGDINGDIRKGRLLHWNRFYCHSVTSSSGGQSQKEDTGLSLSLSLFSLSLGEPLEVHIVVLISPRQRQENTGNRKTKDRIFFFFFL